jgi:hypothetical protein
LVSYRLERSINGEGKILMADSGEITQAIEQLREQLTAVQEGSKDARLRFVVTEVEMEFLVEVTKEGGGSAGIRLGLVSAQCQRLSGETVEG